VIAVANSAGHYFDQDFGSLWMVDLDVFDRVGLHGSMVNGGFHRAFLLDGSETIVIPQMPRAVH
jgi:hypothetical protein